MNEDKSEKDLDGSKRKKDDGKRLKNAVIIAILVSLVFVAASYSMYLKNPKHKYDISRPDIRRTEGLENTETIKEDQSPVDAKTIEEVQTIIEDQLNELKNVGDFSAEPLSDQALLLEDN